ncbi:MAG: hypothetical protein N3A69_13935 [Leptospiraceae bacterium]|nr:hypothetical protein [Leptospiraceae bacterium]
MSELLFKFGKNWGEFLKAYFQKKRINIAKEKLLNSLRLVDMKGYTFLDTESI